MSEKNTVSIVEVHLAKKCKRWRKSLLSSAICGALVVTPAAFAAQTEEAEDKSWGIEVISVTASKSGLKTIQEIPEAIQAIGGDDLEILGATQFNQWASRISGLNFEDDGPGDKDYVIRGINSDLGGTVGVYYDEAVVTGRFTQNGGGHQVDIKLHDMERIEVLKGPQGTLYGANSMSGTIRQLTNKPDLGDFDLSFTSEIIDDSSSVISGMINIPLIEDTVALRMVGWDHNRKGYIDNIRLNLHDINDEQTQGGRLHLSWQASENLNLLLSYTTQDMKSRGRSRFSPSGMAYIGSSEPLGSLPMPEITPTKDFQNGEYTKTPWVEELDLLSLTANWQLKSGDITATFNTLNRDIDYSFDSTPILIFFGAPVPAVTQQKERRELTSTELRYASNFDGPFNFVAGILQQEEQLDFDIGVVTVDGNGDPTGPLSRLDSDDFFLNQGNSIFGRTFVETIKSQALFGEAQYEFNEQWQLMVGARWYESDARTDSNETHPFFGFGDNPPNFEKRKVEDSKFTGKVNLSWQPTDDSLFYLSWANGFRQGGVNSTIVPDPTVEIPDGFSADSLSTWEFGLKSSWFNQKLRLNGAIYHTNWEDMQVADSLSGFSFTDNIGKTYIDGLEFDFVWSPIENLELGLGGAFLSTELQEDEPLSVGIGHGLKGDLLPMVPKFTGYSFAQFSDTLTDSLDILYSLSASYRGSTETELNDNNPFNHQIDSYLTVNLSATIISDSWNVTAFVNNLTDEVGPVDINENLDNALSYIPITPRSAGIRVKYSFF